MSPTDTHEISILLARIDERLANVQADIAQINGSRHCDQHAVKIAEFEKRMANMDRKWWAVACATIVAVGKSFFFSGGAQ